MHETHLDQRQGFLLLVGVMQRQSLHGQGLSVIGILFENQIGLLDGFLVLLCLVMLDNVAKEISLLLGQGTAHACLRILRGGVGHCC